MSLSPLSQRTGPQWHHSLTRAAGDLCCSGQQQPSHWEQVLCTTRSPHCWNWLTPTMGQRMLLHQQVSGCRDLNRPTDWWEAQRPHFPRLNEIIQSQYLQSFTDDSSGCIKATSQKKQNLKMAKWLAGNMWQINRKKSLSLSNLVLCPLNHTFLFNMSPTLGTKFFFLVTWNDVFPNWRMSPFPWIVLSNLFLWKL